MQTSIKPEFLATDAGQEADSILRNCVHCGFCTATCPTYQLLGDELDGPRGRIYQIKGFLEGSETGEKVRDHLDRCLGCRSCETTCPSGVRYHRLLDIGRSMVEQQAPRPRLDRWFRKALMMVIPYPRRFTPLLRMGQLIRPLSFGGLRRSIPVYRPRGKRQDAPLARTMLVLEGCAQSGIAPDINSAANRVLARLGIQLIAAPKAGCCGALHQHLSDQDTAKAMMRANIDAWWPYIESGAEAIIMTASGCGSLVKEYGELLAADPDYADKAKRVSELTRDLSEAMGEMDLGKLNLGELNLNRRGKVAFHAPCSLQHGQQISGVVEKMLHAAGYELGTVSDPHLCCGSAGSYSMLHPGIAGELRSNKLKALQQDRPEIIATANIGCLTHLQAGTDTPVKHWIELLDDQSRW